MKALLILTLFLSFQTLAQDDPTIFFGNSQSGEAISRSTKILSIRSQSSGQVLSNYTIVSFSMYVEGSSKEAAILSYPGSRISPTMEKAMRSAKSGAIVSMVLKVSGPDGIARQVSASFTIN
ncbi:MAG: hypothetical protein ACJASQ_003000 [Crocinitomicaceae bacterium]|jgi:hypothetical protein